MNLGDVFEQLGLNSNDLGLARQPVLRGGPVQTDRGFVLHSPGGDWESTLPFSERLHLTTSRDILTALAEGRGPSNAVVALGYAGWDAGQLDEEMARNAWLTVTADVKLLFDLVDGDGPRPAADLHERGADDARRLRRGADLRLRLGLDLAGGPRRDLVLLDANPVASRPDAIGHRQSGRHAAARGAAMAGGRTLPRGVEPQRLLVGVPYNMDGSDTVLTTACREFASELGRRTSLPVELVDERLTSAAATAEAARRAPVGRARTPGTARGHRCECRAAHPRDVAARHAR
jgi:hypothetical protein